MLRTWARLAAAAAAAKDRVHARLFASRAARARAPGGVGGDARRASLGEPF
jgi:hypothetical protein